MALTDLKATTLLEDFPEAGLLMATDGTIQFANAAAVHLFEATPGLTGHSIIEYLPDNERSRLDPLAWMQRWAESPDAPELQHVHLNCRTATGRELPVRVRVGRIEDGVDRYYLVMLHDVSETLQRQHESRQRYRLAARVLAISADAIITADRSLTITYANPSAEKLFGYPGGQLIGKPLNELLPPQFRPQHEAQIRHFESESTPARLMGERSEVSGLTASGEIIPLEASITKVTLDQEVVFSAHLRDIRARKLAEQELARSLARFSTVFDQALQAMALIDMDGRVLQINQSARTLLPADTRAVGEPFTQLPFWSTDADATARQLREAVAACRAGSVFRLPATIQLPGGEVRDLDFSLSPIADQGQTFAMLAEAHTLTSGASSRGA